MKTTSLWILLVVLAYSVVSAGCAKNSENANVVKETKNEISQSKSDEQPEPNLEGLLKPSALSEQIKEMERIYFDFDQFSLTAEARNVLAANAALLKSAPAKKVRIEGHCDSRGSDEYNLALGDRRSQEVKKYLVSLGVEAERLDIISYGEEAPLDTEQSKRAWAKNRRAEFKILN